MRGGRRMARHDRMVGLVERMMTADSSRPMADGRMLSNTR